VHYISTSEDRQVSIAISSLSLKNFPTTSTARPEHDQRLILEFSRSHSVLTGEYWTLAAAANWRLDFLNTNHIGYFWV
jgi:hypothetical protein